MLRLEDLTKFVLNVKLENVYNGIVVKNSEKLVKVRLWIYSLAFAHLLMIAIKLLTIDFTKAEDPNLWVYESLRWKLITCWFNLVALAYLPVCIYCELKELRGEADQPHVKRLNSARFLIFTSFLLPTTTFADILFWRLWMKDRELIAPEAVDAIVPFWTQHCMHTVTLVFTILDMVVLPRKRPKSFLPGLTVMSLFMVSYLYICVDSYMRGEYLYPVFKLFNGFKISVLFLYVLLEHLFYYYGQFIVYDLIWGKNRKEEKHTF